MGPKKDEKAKKPKKDEKEKKPKKDKAEPKAPSPPLSESPSFVGGGGVTGWSTRAARFYTPKKTH